MAILKNYINVLEHTNSRGVLVTEIKEIKKRMRNERTQRRQGELRGVKEIGKDMRLGKISELGPVEKRKEKLWKMVEIYFLILNHPGHAQ